MNEETKQLLKEIKAYRDEMVAHNYPHQEISDIITKWEHKKDFYEETQKEKQELEESYQESKRQTEERRSNDYSKLLEMWREEKKKRQEAEGEVTIVKGIGMNSPEMRALQKELKEVKEDNKRLALQIDDLEKKIRRIQSEH